VAVVVEAHSKKLLVLVALEVAVAEQNSQQVLLQHQAQQILEEEEVEKIYPVVLAALAAPVS
jgi:hypothetical protein